MSQIQYNSYYKPQQQTQVPAQHQQYVSHFTPKRLPSMAAPSEQFQVVATPNNYTYSGHYESSSQYTTEADSPIKRSVTPYSNISQSPVKLPSFKSLLQSIETPQSANKDTTTLNFDTPLMNSLQLENSNYKPNPYFSSPLPPSEGTFQGAYNYSKLNFDQPQPKTLLAPAVQIKPASTASIANIAVAPISRVESPLQYQTEKFTSAFVPTGSSVATLSPVIFKQPAVQQRKIIGGGISAKPEKKFKCKLCSRGFNTAGNLSRHKKVHTGEKKYKCQFPGCESKFARSDSCMQHYKTHSNENGYTSRRFKKLGDGESYTEA